MDSEDSKKIKKQACNPDSVHLKSTRNSSPVLSKIPYHLSEIFVAKNF